MIVALAKEAFPASSADKRPFFPWRARRSPITRPFRAATEGTDPCSACAWLSLSFSPAWRWRAGARRCRTTPRSTATAAKLSKGWAAKRGAIPGQRGHDGPGGRPLSSDATGRQRADSNGATAPSAANQSRPAATAHSATSGAPTLFAAEVESGRAQSGWVARPEQREGRDEPVSTRRPRPSRCSGRAPKNVRFFHYENLSFLGVSHLSQSPAEQGGCFRAEAVDFAVLAFGLP